MKRIVLALVPIILVGAAVVSGQVTDNTSPVEVNEVVTAKLPSDKKLRSQIEVVMASTSLDTIDATKETLDNNRNKEVVELLKSIDAHLENISRKISR